MEVEGGVFGKAEVGQRELMIPKKRSIQWRWQGCGVPALFFRPIFLTFHSISFTQHFRNSSMRRIIAGFIWLSILPFVVLSTPQDSTKTDTIKTAPKPVKRALPLKADRAISFETSEVTWMSLDVSPDGKTIVFDLLGDLYVVPTSGGKAERISGGMAFDAQPRFSPDGKRVVFTSDRDGSENVWIMTVSMPINDTTAAADSTGLKQLTKGKNAAFYSPEWTPDGNYIVASKIEGLGVNKLWLYHSEGGSGIELMSKEKTWNLIGAAFGPDNRWIYISRKNGRWEYNMKTFGFQIGVYDRESGEFYPLTNHTGGGVRPAVSPDGKWLVYGSRHDAKTGYKIRNLSTGQEEWLLYPVQRDDQESRFTRDMLPGYSFTPDSKAIITSINGKIVRVELSSGRVSDIPFTAPVSVEVGPRVHFETRVDDGPVKVRQIQSASLSPDGSMLAFTALDRLYVQPVAGGTPKRMAEMSAGQFSPAWSPDGKWIAFVTWSESEGGALYKVAARGGNAVKLSSVNAYYTDPVWTPGGNEIVVAKGPWQQRRDMIGGQGMSLVRIPANGGPDKLIAPLKGGRPHFAETADRIYVYEGQEGLVSMKLDGTDRKVHVKVTGYKSPGAERPSPASQVVMGPDGEQAIALVNNHIYIVTVPKVGGDAPSISVLNPESASFPVEKVTTIGGMFMSWGPKAAEVNWSLGNTFFRYHISAAKAFADSLKKLPKKRDEKKEEDAEEPAYEPLTVKVSLVEPREKGSGVIVFRGARILTMKPGAPGDGIIENGTVVVTDNRITAVGPAGSVDVPRNAKVIDATGTTILPGFVDTHAHMWPGFGVHRGIVWEYLANLAYGVLTTRDPQTGTTDVLTYTDLVETGRMPGPRVFYTGPGIFSADQVKSLKDARRVMKRYSEYYHTNTIKQYVAGDRNTRQWLIMAAKEQGIMPTTEGALDMKLDISQIIDGYPGHEHTFPIVPLFRDFVELVAQTQTAYTPTLLVTYGGPWAENYFYETTNVHDDPKVRRFIPHTELDQLTRRRPQWFAEDEYTFRKHAAEANKIVQAGGRVCVGSHGQFQGLGYHWELWLLQSGGMKEIDALRCATIFGAEAIGLSTDLGSVEEGKLADLLVLEKNPLEDIRNTNTLRLVMKNGLLYDANTLDQTWPVQKKLPPLYWENEGPRAR